MVVAISPWCPLRQPRDAARAKIADIAGTAVPVPALATLPQREITQLHAPRHLLGEHNAAFKAAIPALREGTDAEFLIVSVEREPIAEIVTDDAHRSAQGGVVAEGLVIVEGRGAVVVSVAIEKPGRGHIGPRGEGDGE